MQEIVSNIVAWYLKNARDLPWRNTRNPYSVWLSEVLLQQTRVNQGLPYYEKFIAHFPTVAHLAKASEAETPDELQKLPGLGPYTAAAIASIASGYPEPVLDGNVARVVARVLDLHAPVDQPAVRKEITAWLRHLIDGADPAVFNQAWMELGALVCLPARPECQRCPIASHCLARQRGTAAGLPVKKTKAKVKERWFHYLHL